MGFTNFSIKMITNEIFFSNHPHLPTSLNYSQLWKFDVSKKKVENKKLMVFSLLETVEVRIEKRHREAHTFTCFTLDSWK